MATTLISSGSTCQVKPAADLAIDRHGSVARPVLAYTEEVARATAPIYEKVKHIIPAIEWPALAPTIHAINTLKKERNAVILAHNYMTPDIFHGVADVVGDSLQLAVEATRTDADVIVQCGVHFMAETSKILNPTKTVLIPDMRAGCSLAESVTAADVRALRERNPGIPIITYVNTSAAVKAECDICCTSSNAVQVVESLGVPKVFLIPDKYLAANVARQTKVEVLTWDGACEVHERFTAQELRDYRKIDPDVKIIAHPECPPEVVDEADFAGSTKHMIDWVKTNRPAKVMMITECSMADNVASETPGVDYIRPCNLCPHMKRITLAKILDALIEMKEEVTVDPAVAAKARLAVERMINLKM
ncbi:quinolinate synthase NadA [Microvirga tunisiensis]|uniref:Quinolinate synthase NadA n=2 Tax=Pannonibacter tanglangensis TaxID=2750084 RepID=A0ABW9ZNR2_9HYPH|nr:MULTISPECIES: quinolinate synthase NadA [unclassified Pannonibacter]NBN64380.1 quinolinate synthase NadA [Pannonibacter sp. XCT-34]NBN78914.1 quinolinate synthase NadA [Pannonibacter sp. XCT-53]